MREFLLPPKPLILPTVDRLLQPQVLRGCPLELRGFQMQPQVLQVHPLGLGGFQLLLTVQEGRREKTENTRKSVGIINTENAGVELNAGTYIQMYVKI